MVSDVLPVFILLQACGVSLTSYHYIVGVRHVSDDVIKTRAFLKQMRDMAVNPSSYSLFQVAGLRVYRLGFRGLAFRV